MDSICDCGNEGSCNVCSLRRRSLADPPIVYFRRRFKTRRAADGVNVTAHISSSNLGNPASTVDAPPSSTETDMEEEEFDSSTSDSSSLTESAWLSNSEEEESSLEGGDTVVQPSCQDVPPNSNNPNGEFTVVGPTGDGPLRLTLKDPSVLKCSSCTFPLSLPVYQCENGHIACASCCLERKNRCSFCQLDIGYSRCRAIEKVIESIKSQCCYVQHGCIAMFRYSERRAHERKCSFQPCVCPYMDCKYEGMYKELYDHINLQHHTVQFLFNSTFDIDLHKDEEIGFLQEKSEKTLFVLENRCTDGGNLVIIYCIAPSSLKSVFKYKVSTPCGVVQAKAFAKKTLTTIPYVPPDKFLFIPKCYGIDDFINLDITIWSHQGLLGVGSSGTG